MKNVIYFSIVTCLLMANVLSAYVIESPLPKWGSTTKGTAGGTVKWALIPAGLTIKEKGTSFKSQGFKGLTTKQVKQQITKAFDRWQAAANINFKEVSYIPTGTAPQPLLITVGAHSFGPGNTSQLGFTLYSITSNPRTVAADIQFNSDWKWEIGNAQGSKAMDLLSVALHEIGHALGLDHGKGKNSVMRSALSSTSYYTGLSADDIAGIQSLYGVKPGTKLTTGSGTVGGTQTNPRALHTPEPMTYLLLGAFLLLAALRTSRKNVIQVS